MDAEGERLLGAEAFYTFSEYLRGAFIGSKELYVKLGRASSLKILVSMWVVQSVVVLASKLALDSGIRYEVANLPPWVANIDVIFYSDRAMTLQAVASAFIIPALMGLLMVVRGALASYVARRMGRDLPLSAAVMATSPVLVPEALRAVALVAAKRLTVGNLVILYDLSVAYSPKLLQELSVKTLSDLQRYYSFDLTTSAIVGAAFLVWEAFLIYRAFRYSVGLERENSAWATAAIMIFQGWLALKYPLSPIVPKYFLDPLNFRFAPAAGGFG
ncbi:MAG: hypothetical protein QI223_08735 [Candidatus Korarchaeota archaeon]|nr:hypothetical protein [Candidatus Korarchaeota archaeon]